MKTELQYVIKNDLLSNRRKMHVNELAIYLQKIIEKTLLISNFH